jgi:hypothetical protein
MVAFRSYPDGLTIDVNTDCLPVVRQGTEDTPGAAADVQDAPRSRQGSAKLSFTLTEVWPSIERRLSSVVCRVQRDYGGRVGLLG